MPTSDDQPPGKKPSGSTRNLGRGARGPAQRPGRSRYKNLGHYRQKAGAQLRRFRQGTLLAVAITSFLLMFFEIGDAQENGNNEIDASDAVAIDPTPISTPVDTAESVGQATAAIRELVVAAYGFLPKIFIAICLLIVGWAAARIIRLLFRRLFGFSPKGTMAFALTQLGLFFITIVAAISVIVGDIRALIGSLGLIGLALSWALQSPIESFAGWLVNTFRAYYRVGDRIEVGEVFGDVYRIDVLTTTVWEVGGPGKSVTGAQATGALITFPNSDVLRSNIINYSRDFPFVWDEVIVGVTNESDLNYTARVLGETADKVMGPTMAESSARYRRLLSKAGLDYDIADKPQVFFSLTESYVNCTIRYLVKVRERRRWSSALIQELHTELLRPEHLRKIVGAYPRTEVLLGSSSEPSKRTTSEEARRTTSEPFSRTTFEPTI